MTQNTWPLPLGNDFADIKDAVDDIGANLATNHKGTSAPSGADLHDSMWWYDETNDLMKLEDTAGTFWTIFKGEANGGLLWIDGTNEMTADLDMADNALLDPFNDTTMTVGAQYGRLKFKVGATTYACKAYALA